VKLVLETTAPFQGLPELVAYDEGLFAKEELDVEWVDREQVSAKAAGDTGVTRHTFANTFASHGSLLEQGKTRVACPITAWNTRSLTACAFGTADTAVPQRIGLPAPQRQYPVQ